MSTQTTLTPTTPAAPAPAPPAPLLPSPEVVNAILKWPVEKRDALAHLLLDSVREGFTSLEEVERRDKDMIRQRIEDAVSGKVPTYDAFEVIEEMRRTLERLRA